MKTKLVTMLTIAMMLLGAFAALPVRSTLPTALSVVPSTIDKWSDVDHVTDTFTVDIVADVVSPDAFFGWELVLEWTPGVIDCTLEALNTALWGAGNYLGPWIPVPIDNVAGEYHQSLTGKAPGVPVTGTFTLVTLTFAIVASAPFMGVVTTNLHLKIAEGYIAYCLLDGASEEIVHSFNDAAYSYHWAPPTTNPYLEVVPANNIFSGKNIYKTPFSFEVDVYVRDVVVEWRLAGVEFLMFYNTTVLDVLEVKNGTFFHDFTAPPGGDFFYYSLDEAAGKIRVIYTILDIPHMIPPEGDGIIATIVFNATYQEMFPNFVWSNLDLEIDVENGMGSYFVNFVAEELPGDPEIDGYYQLNGFVVGRVIDLYDQYPDPFGGQGPHTPSDMFWPQKEMQLYANITYNEWPVQNKLVGFEVRGPHGELVDILTATSDAYGVAYTTYRIPWPCDDPESWFGVWTITASVDIACIVVNDTMQFHFDYLVHWYGGDPYKVTTDKEDYGHCEYINVTVTFGSHSQMPRWVLLTVSVHDELNYPIGTAAVWIQVSGTVFCQLKNYTSTLPIHVVKWTAAGVATIYVNAYSDFPSIGGSPWAPTFDPAPTVNILATWA
jgi:hypothetical protein